ncbi:hypothetical protein ElyMa_002581800 [Elysia marginata]|uniref:Uncharacterized protein n=1 Tax=Elysia marginata TaxID=1093978 RepID=A0AAV4H0D5_9GAST|nr:hypothetical protein ElyMa_002581800 [Elysia marginata]
MTHRPGLRASNSFNSRNRVLFVMALNALHILQFLAVRLVLDLLLSSTSLPVEVIALIKTEEDLVNGSFLTQTDGDVEERTTQLSSSHRANLSTRKELSEKNVT